MEKIKNKNYKNLTPFKGWVIENFPFIEADFDAITNYQLICKVTEYLNTVIYNQNQVQDLSNELVNGYNNLLNYVNNYFDNLDVQEEINNKLDQMVEQGTLQEIIADYLNSKAIFGFDNVESMKSATNLIDGSYAKTLGYHYKNDNGSALYKIRLITNDDVVDNATIIPLNDNTLIAELIIENNTVTPEMFGAYGDGIHDDTSYFNLINTKFDNENPVLNIQGKIGKNYIIENLVTHFISIKDCSFYPKNEYVSNGINMHSRTTLYHCVFSHFNKAIYTEGSVNVYSEINNCTIQYNRFGAYFIGTASGGLDYSTNDLRIINSYFVKNGTNADDMSAESTPTNGYGIYIDNSFHNVLIQGNLIEYNTFTGIYLNQNEAIHNNGCTIIGNYFEGNRDSAIYMNGSINMTHMIMITGNFYTSGLTNIRNTRYINVKQIFRTSYIMEDIYPITVKPSSSTTGVTNNENHTITYSHGCSQYQNFTPVHVQNNIYKVKFLCVLKSNITLNVANSKNYQLTNGYNEINIFGISPNNWYFTRALDEDETITLIGSWS